MLEFEHPPNYGIVTKGQANKLHICLNWSALSLRQALYDKTQWLFGLDACRGTSWKTDTAVADKPPKHGHKHASLWCRYVLLNSGRPRCASCRLTRGSRSPSPAASPVRGATTWPPGPTLRMGSIFMAGMFRVAGSGGWAGRGPASPRLFGRAVVGPGRVCVAGVAVGPSSTLI